MTTKSPQEMSGDSQHDLDTDVRGRPTSTPSDSDIMQMTLAPTRTTSIPKTMKVPQKETKEVYPVSLIVLCCVCMIVILVPLLLCVHPQIDSAFVSNSFSASQHLTTCRPTNSEKTMTWVKDNTQAFWWGWGWQWFEIVKKWIKTRNHIWFVCNFYTTL